MVGVRVRCIMLRINKATVNQKGRAIYHREHIPDAKVKVNFLKTIFFTLIFVNKIFYQNNPGS